MNSLMLSCIIHCSVSIFLSFAIVHARCTFIIIMRVVLRTKLRRAVSILRSIVMGVNFHVHAAMYSAHIGNAVNKDCNCNICHDWYYSE